MACMPTDRDRILFGFSDEFEKLVGVLDGECHGSLFLVHEILQQPMQGPVLVHRPGLLHELPEVIKISLPPFAGIHPDCLKVVENPLRPLRGCISNYGHFVFERKKWHDRETQWHAAQNFDSHRII